MRNYKLFNTKENTPSKRKSKLYKTDENTPSKLQENKENTSSKLMNAPDPGNKTDFGSRCGKSEI